MSDRQANLAKIHIGKKQLGLDELQYRTILHGITGKHSSKDMNPLEHRQVIAELVRRGFRSRSTQNEVNFLLRAIPKLFHQVSRANNEVLALRRRLFKFSHVTDLEQLSIEQLKEVYEDLQRAAYHGAHQW